MPVQSQEPLHFREHKIFGSVFTSVFKLFLKVNSIFSQDFLKRNCVSSKIISGFDAEQISLARKKTRTFLEEKNTKKDIKWMRCSLFQLRSQGKILC